MATYQYRHGDTITMDPSVLTKRDGTAPDGTGGAGVFAWEDFYGTLVFSRTATIATANPLKLQYTFVTADGTRQGTFRAKWVYTYSGGVIETFPTSPDDLLLVVY